VRQDTGQNLPRRAGIARRSPGTGDTGGYGWHAASIANLDPTTRWLVIIASVLTLVYVVLRPLRRKKDPLVRPSAQPSLASQRALERDMNSSAGRIVGDGAANTAQLDTRRGQARAAHQTGRRAGGALIGFVP